MSMISSRKGLNRLDYLTSQPAENPTESLSVHLMEDPTEYTAEYMGECRIKYPVVEGKNNLVQQRTG